MLEEIVPRGIGVPLDGADAGQSLLLSGRGQLDRRGPGTG